MSHNILLNLINCIFHLFENVFRKRESRDRRDETKYVLIGIVEFLTSFIFVLLKIMINWMSEQSEGYPFT